MSLRFVLSRVCVFLYSLGPYRLVMQVIMYIPLVVFGFPYSSPVCSKTSGVLPRSATDGVPAMFGGPGPSRSARTCREMPCWL